jgi:hypothetical protein
MMLSKVIDTTVRGIVYEAAGSAGPDAFALGLAELRRICGLNEIPFEVVDEDPVDVPAWAAASRRAIDRLLGTS